MEKDTDAIYVRECSAYVFSQWSKSDREREIVYDIPYMWNLYKTKDTDEKRKRLTDLDNELRVAGGRDS